MSQGPLCSNLTKKFQKEVSQMANRNLSLMILLGGLSVNLNHLKIVIVQPVQQDKLSSEQFSENVPEPEFQQSSPIPLKKQMYHLK